MIFIFLLGMCILIATGIWIVYWILPVAWHCKGWKPFYGAIIAIGLVLNPGLALAYMVQYLLGKESIDGFSIVATAMPFTLALSMYAAIKIVPKSLFEKRTK